MKLAKPRIDIGFNDAPAARAFRQNEIGLHAQGHGAISVVRDPDGDWIELSQRARSRDR
jgi:hypothetical protein